MAFATKRISEVPDVIARDGSEVRVLCALSRGGMATFTLLPGAVSRAVAHRTIEEVWYFIRGHGRLWRKSADAEEITEIGVGLLISIPIGVHFQFRCDGAEPLEAVAATMPPWPGEGEAYVVEGVWPPTV
jgi:mannose-6-phosphate isomerase-like protein (cupin superfamily)